jgi:hypothetical protein
MKPNTIQAYEYLYRRLHNEEGAILFSRFVGTGHSTVGVSYQLYRNLLDQGASRIPAKGRDRILRPHAALAR